jgi:K+-sensing histidine kinase KdpD
VRRPRLQRRQKGGALVLELFMILALISARVSYNCISSSNPSLIFFGSIVSPSKFENYLFGIFGAILGIFLSPDMYEL